MAAERRELLAMDADTDRGMALDSTQTAAERRRWIAVIVLCLGQLMLAIDATVANVALPAIQRDLHFSQSALAWVVNGYLLTFGGLLLLAGRLGDLLGRKRVFLAGLALFTLASLLCGLAGSQGLLIAARCIQGVAAACASAMILGILFTVFSDARDRAKAVGIYTFVAVSGGSIGLLAGGALTQTLSWHWIFFINLPVGIIAFALGALLIPDQPGNGLGHGIDVLGSLLVTAAPGLAVYTIIQASDSGWGSARTIGLAGGTLVLTLLFVLLESRIANPLVPLRIFRSRHIVGANLVRALFACGLYGTFFVGTLYLQHAHGYGAWQTGAAFVPQTVTVAVFSLWITRRVVAFLGARQTVLIGCGLSAAGSLLWARVPISGNYFFDVLPALLLAGIGGGLAFMPTVALAMSGAGPEDAGLASGLANISVQMGGALGVAVLASISTMRTHDLLPHGRVTKEALTSGYDLGFVVAGGCVALAVVVAALLLGPTAESLAITSRGAQSPGSDESGRDVDAA